MACTSIVVPARNVVSLHLGCATRSRLGWNVATQLRVTVRSSTPAQRLTVVAGNGDRERNVGNAASATVYSGGGIEEKVNKNRGQLGYVLVFVPDVNKAADFYEDAFGLQIRPQNKSNSWIEMETGATTLAFTPVEQHETELIGELTSTGNNSVMINLDFSDVGAAYQLAISQGATAVAPPEEKSWSQKVGYMKDLFGNIVRLGSFPEMLRARLGTFLD